MTPRAFIVLLAASAVALTAAAPPHSFPACVHQDFDGITQTLPDGTIVGDPDVRDWGCADRGGGAGSAGATDAVRALPGGSVGALGVPVPPPTVLCSQPAAPNPAIGSTRLEFALPAAGQVSFVVYGRQWGHGPRETFIVRTLADRMFLSGAYQFLWDLKDD